MPEPEITESDDEGVIEDAFALGKNKVSLAGEEDDDSLDEEAVYNLSDDESESSGDEEDESEDDEPDLDEEIERGGKAGRLARQAKFLEERLKLQQKEDDDEEGGSGKEEEEEDAARERLWGASKRAYYGGDDAEAEPDEDVLQGEEEEAVRLQAQRAARLDDDDFGIDGTPAAAAAAAAGPEQEGEGGAAAAAAGARRRPRAAAGVEVEAVAKDLSSLTEEERMSALMSDAPELTSLLEELGASLAEARHRVGPVLQEVREGGLATPEGLSYLEAKQQLLLQYSMCIVAYLLLKAEGRSVKNHPVIARLVQLRSYFDRMRPIDRQLAYQVDKLLRTTEHVRAAAATEAGADGGSGGEDALGRHRRSGSGGGGAAAGGAAPMEVDGGGERRQQQEQEQERQQEQEQQRRKKRKEAKRTARRGALAKELTQELSEGPGPAAKHGRGSSSGAAAAALAARLREEARAAADEGAAAGGLPLSKQEAVRLKAQRRAGLSGRGLLQDLEDDVSAAAAAAGGPGAEPRGARLGELFGRQRLSQKFGADITEQLRSGRGGDDDAPRREPLHERRAKYDMVAAIKAAREAGYGNGGEEGEDGDGYDYEAGKGDRKRRAGGGGGEEDEFYSHSKAARSATKADKRRRHEVPALAPPLPDESVEGQRPISYAIKKNRGLTPHRRKDLKNPRKKHRVKFAAAQVRRKGQVQGVREAQGTGYSGEATGVKANVAKGRKLG